MMKIIGSGDYSCMIDANNIVADILTKETLADGSSRTLYGFYGIKTISEDKTDEATLWFTENMEFVKATDRLVRECCAYCKLCTKLDRDITDDYMCDYTENVFEEKELLWYGECCAFKDVDSKE